MAKIFIDSITQFQNSASSTATTTGTGFGNTAGTAQANARWNCPTPGSPSPYVGSGGSSNTTGRYFGTSLSVGGVVGPTAGTASLIGWDESGSQPTPVYKSTATASRTNTGTVYQLKLDFPLPNIDSSLIASATLKFNFSYGWSGGTYSFGLYAPKASSAQTRVESVSDTSIIQKFYTISANSDNPSQSTIGSQSFISGQSFDITSAFKRCLDNAQGWLTFSRDTSMVGSGPRITITSTPEIEYTLTTQSAHEPTTVNISSSVQAPNGSVGITWSGAAGDVNNTITGYTVYWKIGENPTTNSFTGSAEVSTTESFGDYSFIIPSNSSRGSSYYFKILTRGSAGSDWYSSLSESVTVRVNSLPDTPIVVPDKTRIKSVGATTINFDITPGSDNDIGQTLEVHFAYSETGQKTKCENQFSQTLSEATSLYFWTYDGLEYSTNYTLINISINNPPTLTGTFQMGSIATFSPTISGQSYVKNISLTLPTITKDNAATLTYDWYFVTAAAGETPIERMLAPFGNSSSGYTNLDVTAVGIDFNTAYKVRLIITDDLNESASLDTTNTFCIPSAPSFTLYNQKANSNVDGANNAYFGRYIRIKYSQNNTGLTRKLQYKLNTDTTWNEIILTGTEYSDVDLNSLIRDNVYNFRIVFTCNSINNITSAQNRTRAKDITPTNINVIGATVSNQIKPYSDNNFSVSFYGPMAFTAENNVDTSYNNIYTTSIEYNNRNMVLNSSGTDSNSLITSTWILNNKTTQNWIDLINGSDSTSAPNAQYNATIKIIATNKFNETFVNTTLVTLNFVEGAIINNNLVKLQIQMNDNSWKDIPIESQRYRTFEGQNIRVEFSPSNGRLQCKANQTGIIQLIRNNEILNSASITVSDWTAPSGQGNYLYTLNTSKFLNYTLPLLTTSIDMNYEVKVILSNGTTTIINNINNLKSTRYYKITPGDINFSLTSCSEINSILSLGWECTNFGGDIENTDYTTGYSAISIQPQYSNMPTGTYTNVGSSFSLDNVGTSSMSSSGVLEGIETSSIIQDIIYFGATVTLVLNFQAIDSIMPMGSSTRIYSCVNQQTLYRATPNLTYGKNFFAFNSSIPRGTSDELLTIRSSNNRKKIYIGDNDQYAGTFIITDNVGLVIDCGSWDT